MSAFAHIAGNEKQKSYLSRMVCQKRIPQSLLFAGPDGVGKSLFALALAQLLFSENDPDGKQQKKIKEGIHPDLRMYRPEGKIGMHSIESMRQFIDEVYLPPHEAHYKIFIIHDAERMLSYSANALLKTFEEPPIKSVIILLSHQPEVLLPTILSRCSKIHFQALSKEDIVHVLTECQNRDEKEAERVANIAQGSMKKAIGLLEEEKNDLRQLALTILSKGSMKLYSQLTDAVQSINQHIEKKQKDQEEALRETLLKAYPDGAGSIQQNAIDKEIEGMLTLFLSQEANKIFDNILSWYRDIHLLLVKGDESYLINSDFRSEIESVIQKGEIFPLERILKMISQAKLSLARSTSFPLVLENLFLQLKI